MSTTLLLGMNWRRGGLLPCFALVGLFVTFITIIVEFKQPDGLPVPASKMTEGIWGEEVGNAEFSIAHPVGKPEEVRLFQRPFPDRLRRLETSRPEQWHHR